MFHRGNILVILALGLLLLAIFYFITITDAQSIPSSVIRTVQDEQGYYLECEGNCQHFDNLQLDNTLRFCKPFQAINYMYDRINTIDNLHLGPLTPYDYNTVC